MSDIKIDKCFPIPGPWTKHRSPKFPFLEMEIGDSFYSEGSRPAAPKNTSHKKFTIRKEGEKKGWRVWRIE